MWLALAFGGIVLASLVTSGMIYFELLPGSPLVLSVVGGLHALFGGLFFKAYLDYRTVHRLIGQGRGELFSYVIAALIQRSRTRGFADHYRVRHVQGAALAGLPDRALEAADAFRRDAKKPDAQAQLDVTSAEVAANIEMGRTWWAEQCLERGRALAGDKAHRGLDAAAARLAWLRGDWQAAADQLERLPREGRFPFGRVVDARIEVWLGDALRDSGRATAAAAAYGRAIRHAPHSHWADLAHRGHASVSIAQRAS